MSTEVFFVNEIFDFVAGRGTARYEAIRLRPGCIPEPCGHIHPNVRTAKQCRVFESRRPNMPDGSVTTFDAGA